MKQIELFTSMKTREIKDLLYAKVNTNYRSPIQVCLMSPPLPHSASERLSPEPAKIAISGESPSASVNPLTRWWPQAGVRLIIFYENISYLVSEIQEIMLLI